MRELSLLQRDSALVPSTRPAEVWRDLVPLELLQQTVEQYPPLESAVKSAAIEVLVAAKVDLLTEAGDLVRAIEALEKGAHELNRKFVVALAEQIEKLG